MKKGIKKFTALFICLSILCNTALTGCIFKKEEETLYTANTTSQLTPKSEPEPEPDPASLLPIMDGSTSAAPLEAGIRAEILGIPYKEALEQVAHTTTHQSFERLINGEVDMIFSVPISKEQEKAAENAGFEPENIPVALEGFVFAVNIENPVDVLTSEQIRGIYSGEIANWSEVGGDDEEIIAYQRNKDSGSQNYMTEFMGATPLLEPETGQVPGAMGSLMDAVSIYDNSKQAIGYSVYSYAAQMYANANKVKFIKVDGVAPTKATMADKTYPLLSATYIYFDKKLSEDSNVRKLTEWISSEDGQLCVLKSGYIPVIDMDIPSYYLPYETPGTGSEKPEDYTPSELYWSLNNVNFKHKYDKENALTDRLGKTVYPLTELSLEILQDKDFEKEINKWLADSLEEMKPYREQIDFSKSSGVFLNLSDNLNIFTDLYVRANVINGYLSIEIGYPSYLEPPYDGPAPQYYEHFYVVKTAVFDLIGKEKIENFSDLFYKGVDFIPLINNILNEDILNYYETMYGANIKTDFSGLLGEVEDFSLEYLYFNMDNAYFYTPVQIYYLNEFIKDYSVVWEYRSMDGIFTDDYKLWEWVSEPEFGYNYGISVNKNLKYTTEEYRDEKNKLYTRIAYSRFLSDEEISAINEELTEILDMLHSQEYAYLNHYNGQGYATLTPSIYENIIYFDTDRFAFEKRIYVDRETRKILTPDDIFVDGYKEHLSYTDNYQDGGEFIGFYEYPQNKITFYYEISLGNGSYQGASASIDASFIREKYKDILS